MECPSCGKEFEGSVIFCPVCGKKLPDIIKEQIRQEILSEFEEVKKSDIKNNLSIFSKESDIKKEAYEIETGDISYETDDIRKIEYKKLLKEVFADRCVTADELKVLAVKRKELGFDKSEAETLQHDVEKELGIEINDEGELLATDVIFETNENIIHSAGEVSNLEIRITNIYDTVLEKVSLSGYFANLKQKNEKNVGKLKVHQSQIVYLPFQCFHPGNEIAEIILQYSDSKGNPSVWSVNVPIRICSKVEEKDGSISIGNISYAAGGSMVVDAEDMINISELVKKQKPEKISSYSDTEKKWIRRCMFFDEYETQKRRNEILINKKIKEGEDKFLEGMKLKNDAETMGKNAAIETFKDAFNLLNESKECFKKVREIDPGHAVAFEKVKEIRAMISEIEAKIGIIEKEPVAPPIKLSSGCLTVNNLQKKFYVYSKDRIMIGRDSKNDMVLRLIPFQPKEQYTENWQKSCQISGIHAEIINKGGQFYIRDIGSNNTGSANGTFLDGKRLRPLEDYQLKDDMRINIAKVLDLECHFLGEFKKGEKESDMLSSCHTVLGEKTDSCFGIDKIGIVDAIKFRRRNNFTDGEKYIILIREVTIGKNRSNGIVIDSDKVSDIHAKIFYKDNQYWIEDLNSKHGTFVNDKRVPPGAEMALSEQSEIIIGDIKLKFEGYA